jgi:hypothetical protein
MGFDIDAANLSVPQQYIRDIVLILLNAGLIYLLGHWLEKLSQSVDKRQF